MRILGKIILVTGGARSGKSTFAEKLALKIGNGRAAYIATAQIFDEEMERRVKIHRERRKENWQTWESPKNADKSILQAGKNFDVILFDCVTIYVSNFLLANETKDFGEIEVGLKKLIEDLISAAKKSGATIIFVTNEVGSGIVPENKLARQFRDLAGIANQILAANAEKVFLTVSGIAVDVKKLSFDLEKDFA